VAEGAELRALVRRDKFVECLYIIWYTAHI
jgi:hypothetical protein